MDEGAACDALLGDEACLKGALWKSRAAGFEVLQALGTCLSAVVTANGRLSMKAMAANGRVAMDVDERDEAGKRDIYKSSLKFRVPSLISAR